MLVRVDWGYGWAPQISNDTPTRPNTYRPTRVLKRYAACHIHKHINSKSVYI